MRDLFLSHFTPSLMRHEDLEAIFVQDRRKRWVDAIVQGVREAALGGSIPSYLTIGARGMGKTHILSLVYHRLKADPEMEGKLALAWLREEEWGVASFLDLLMRLLSALDSEEPDAGLADRIAAIPDARDPEAAAANLLLSAVGERVLAVLIENLDDLFAGMGDIEQKRLRAFLQDHRFCSLVATAPALFNGIRRETSPFYGFFAIEHLSELSLDEARELLVGIARRAESDELVTALESPLGRARVRAVHHLAGGNPRVYVIFYQFLTGESLDELVEPFMRTVDELTPYYQARMQLLSQQQRKIVNYLCEKRGAVPVKEIARDSFMSHQTASTALKQLRERYYVRCHDAGRESWYELREPLMRLCFEAKKTRGTPVKLFVQFLRIWYSREDLTDLVARLCHGGRLNATELLQDLDRAGVDEVWAPAREDWRQDVGQLVASGQWERLLSCAEEGSALADPASGLAQALALLGLERFPAVLATLDDARRVLPDELITELEPVLSYVTGLALIGLGRHQEAEPHLRMGVEVLPSDSTPRMALAGVLVTLGRYADALQVVAPYAERSDDPEAWALKLACESGAGRREDAADSGRRLLKLVASQGVTPARLVRIALLPTVALGALVTMLVGREDQLWADMVAASRVCPELARFVDLADASFEYRQNRDKRVLLRLPAEDREVVQQITDLMTQARETTGVRS